MVRFLPPLALLAVIAAVGLAAADSSEDDPAPPASGRANAVVDRPYPELRPTADIPPPGERSYAALGVYPALRAPSSLAFPSPRAVDVAKRWLATRGGHVSFAVLGQRGGLAGVDAGRTYESASLVKAMILVAFLRNLSEQGREPTSGEVASMDVMIRVSDNFSATQLFESVGPEGLTEVAKLAGMTDFAASSIWGACLISAADQARFFLALDRLLPPEHRDYARGLLASVIPEHSWGIPAAARPDWEVYFKGGWRPDDDEGQIVHQAALLERGPKRVAIAVLTDQNPSEAYGHETIRGVAQRLLRPTGAPPPPAVPGLLAPLSSLTGYHAPEPKPLE